MPLNILIRDEQSADAAEIAAITAAAFAPLEISSHTEHYIVDALRASGALTVSLVADLDGRIVGHIAFSPVRISDGSVGWYGLGPVSVAPGLQRRGIGTALITEGLVRLRAIGASGCCLVGHPAYYPRFDFSNPSGLSVAGVPPDVFFVLSFNGETPRGEVEFHEAFKATGPSNT
ncbi:GNAT family N-acetyltransferase [Niveibacterium sp.]|uniref:GNAT family N-acetyltransferase n=1 Tax=Niveibacterium sp. TaxID=2017444 RepID=UPI0035B019A4